MAGHSIKFYPLGNADTTLISLSNGKHILWDFANVRDINNSNDKRIDLVADLSGDVLGDFEVVTFTHADRDHICGFSDFFFLEHAAKYQKGERKKIEQLWVPASVLLDTHAEDEAKILKAEARFRLKNRQGILVFSRPKKMKDWCDAQEDISYENVKHLFVDAGTLVPGFSLDSDGVEVFSHSPFQSESQNIDRNAEAIVVQMTFDDNCSTKLIMGSDCTYGVWDDIVSITKYHDRENRLEWDIFHISHHCSYLSLNEEKGEDMTVPTPNLKWLYEEKSIERCRLVSSSHPIPKKGSEQDNDQPPHCQAASYYESVANGNDGEFKVTMEEPNESEPGALIIEIDKVDCAKLKKATTIGAAAFIGGSRPPRAG